jgi:heme exporter protein D
MNLAVVASSKWRPVLMVSPITRQRQYLAHVLRGQRRARRLRLPSQTALFLDLSES